MHQPSLPLTRDLVLIGGGHTHALVLKSWAMDPLPGVRLTVINPGPTAPYSGMLPGFIAGHYRRDELDIDLVRLVRRAGGRVIMAKATGIDRAARRIAVEGRPPVGYDYASLDIGITSTLTALPGFVEHGLPAKPLGPFATAWDAFINEPGPARVAVIGAGVAGAEVAMAMAYSLREAGRAAEITLVDQGPALAAISAGARRRMLREIASYGVRLIERARPARVEPDRLILESGEEIASDLTVGAAGSNPYPWLAETGLTDAAGFVTVDKYLRSDDARIFAVGDCAEMVTTPRPKAGVFAVRQAPILFNNLRHVLSRAGAMKPYPAQKDYLRLISTGRKSAVGDKWGLSTEGDWLWRLKDRIDEKFMGKLNGRMAPMKAELPWPRARGGAELPAMMCAGCGSKVGRGALAQGIGALGDDAATLGGQVLSTDHLRAFVEDPVVMTRIAAIHALGDVWSMGAAPEAALAQIILPRQSEALAERALAEIMETARATFAEFGAKIVGGHTSQGAEFIVGFTVTGRTEAPLTHGGAQPGDALILTKPIGSGTIMAAAMQDRVSGHHIVEALRVMLEPSHDASRILRAVGARAMTDVTGFGLRGHIDTICAASGVSFDLDMGAVPLLPGALEMAEAGVRSSIFEANGGHDALAPLEALAFDPQTAGGLLAAAPDGEAARDQLASAGISAAVLGRFS
ncbi:MAG: selenide, water dikinase SelD [Pseudomonadota bacterium]